MLLRAPEVQKDPRRYLQAVQKVIACMTLGINVSKLFSEMIMVRGIVCFHGRPLGEYTKWCVLQRDEDIFLIFCSKEAGPLGVCVGHLEGLLCIL